MLLMESLFANARINDSLIDFRVRYFYLIVR